MFRFLFKASFQFTRSQKQTLPVSFSPLRYLSQATADHLVHSHGFSPNEALTISNLFPRRPPKSFDPVFTFLKDYGFSPTDIAAMVIKCPGVFTKRADQIIKSKLNFFSEKGISSKVIVHTISNNPYILRSGLKNQLMPCINCLVNIFGVDNVESMMMMRRGTWILRVFNHAVEHNIRILLELGVPKSHIIKMFTVRSTTLSRDPSYFREAIGKIKQMGMDPSSLMFIHGVCCYLGSVRERWVAKMAVFRKFGWSDDQIKALFVKQPPVMRSSTARTEKVLSFLINDLGWTVDHIISYPVVLSSSFQNKILPRATVFRILLSKSLVKETSMGRALLMPEDEFLRKYLMAHAEKAPQILEIYTSTKGLNTIPGKSRLLTSSSFHTSRPQRKKKQEMSC